MIVVADASVLVSALTQFDNEGNELRAWLSGLANGGPVDIVRNLLTDQEVSGPMPSSKTSR